MRNLLGLLLLLTLALAPGPVAADGSPRPISGQVTAINQELRIVQLGLRTFDVPAHIEEFDELTPGLPVEIYYEYVDGHSVVTEIEIPEAG